MALFEWSNQFCLGIGSIDKQHQKLINSINGLHHSMISEAGDENLSKILKELIDYTDSHFKYEEKLFQLHGYPLSEEHQKHHQELISQIVEYSNNFDSGKQAMSSDIMNFLKNWLMNHILKEDKEYVAFFKDKGVK